jgi:hypothetical protein
VSASPPKTLEATLYTGHETLEVVGESNYQDALWRIVGGRVPDPVRYKTVALLIPEPTNDHDPNAIEVLIDGHLVGYLSREDAGAYRPGLIELMAASANHLVALEAVICGGGPRRDGIGYLGVFINHDPADFGLTGHYASGEHLRTGLSAAIATDREDERYDLSWYKRLSADDDTAIEEMRSLLETERDAIDRHFMLGELERRLYGRRTVRPSALDEFDAVCQQHDEEMVAIRAALLEKFGVIPVIPMYRQAAIRCQKAKRWQSAHDWAERGIAVYADHAARSEVVEDLHKRLQYATAKIEAASNTRERPPSRSRVMTAVSGSELEELICGSCGGTFTRVRVRGRKPKMCPACASTTVSNSP